MRHRGAGAVGPGRTLLCPTPACVVRSAPYRAFGRMQTTALWTTPVQPSGRVSSGVGWAHDPDHRRPVGPEPSRRMSTRVLCRRGHPGALSLNYRHGCQMSSLHSNSGNRASLRGHFEPWRPGEEMIEMKAGSEAPTGPPEFAAETPASSSGPFGVLLRFLGILPLHHQAAGCSLVAPPPLAFLSPQASSPSMHHPRGSRSLLDL